MEHADIVFDTERAARKGLPEIAAFFDDSTADQEKKARIGLKLLAQHASLRSTRQREITGAFNIGKEIGAPKEAMARLFEALTGQEVAHLLPDDRERSGDGGAPEVVTG